MCTLTVIKKYGDFHKILLTFFTFINKFHDLRTMTTMIQANLEVGNVDSAEEWTNEIVNVYADMEISDVSISGNKISFKAGLSGMDDTTGDDIKLKIDEYATMSDVEIKNISC